MPAELQLYYEDTVDPLNAVRCQWLNVVNSPILSATWLGNGEAYSDVYHLHFSRSGAVVTVDVTADNPINTYAGTGKPVVADDATPNYDLVPGIAVVVSSAVDTNHVAVMTIGARLRATADTDDVLNMGVVRAGQASSARRVLACNVGDAMGCESYVRALPGHHWVPSAPAARDAIARVCSHTDPEREHLAAKSEHVITFANLQDGAGEWIGYRIVDVYDNGVLCLTGAPLLEDPAEPWQYGHSCYNDTLDLLQGLAIIPKTVLTTDPYDPTPYSITIRVMDGSTWHRIAPDNSGVPGDWQAANVKLELTQSGQNSGCIAPSGSAIFWLDWAPPKGTAPDAYRPTIWRGYTESV
jgi:hypothetical protein